MEACGGAHWWARQLIALGHEVRLLSAKAVRLLVLRKAFPATLASLDETLPGMLVDTLREQWVRIQSIDHEIVVIERRLKQALSETPACQAIADTPCVGLLIATAAVAVASMGDPLNFKTGREFAAWQGLLPRQTSTGGRIRQLGVSKRGDVYLRTLLMHGARAIIASGKRTDWVAGLLARSDSVVMAAIANKLARTIWVVLAKGWPYKAAAFSVAM